VSLYAQLQVIFPYQIASKNKVILECYNVLVLKNMIIFVVIP